VTFVELLPPEKAVHGNPEWYALRREGVTASEIASILGISPWESPFSAYWSKVNGWHSPDNDEMSAGRRAEPLIADWYAERHHELIVCPAGLYAHRDRPWQMASPDRLLCDPQMHDNPFPNDWPDWPHQPGNVVAALEAKYLVGGWDGWGEPFTDEIPVHYRAQALWQLDVLGVDETHVAAWHGADLRVYIVRRDDTDLAMMRDAAQAFLRRIALGDEPDIDEHSATLRTLKALHPSVDDRDQEIPADIADGYRAARSARGAAQADLDLWEARLRAAMGDARRAVCAGQTIATRSIFDRAAHEVSAGTVDRLTAARSPK
jgi:putative phage-type endonuclease